MAEEVGKQLQVGLGFKIDDVNGGIAKLAEDSEKINKIMKDLASSMAGVEKAINKNTTATKNSSKANDDWLKNLKNARDAGLITVEEYNKKVLDKEKELYNELRKVQDKEGMDSTQFKKQLAEFATVHKEMTKIQAQELKQQQTQLEKSTNQSINDFKKLGREIDSTFSAHQSLSDRILNSMLVYGAIGRITSEFQNLGRAIIDINYNTINNQRLMGNFSVGLRDSLNGAAADIARNTGIMITDAQEIQGAWIRINDEYAKNSDLLNEISGLTAKFMNVGEIENAESAVKLLNASLLQFNVSASESMKYAEEFANKWAYMADVTAMGTADEYGQAIAKFGANVKALNGDMDDAIALSSVMADKLAKNGLEAGNALKTFTTYMNRDKTISLFADIAQDLGDVSFNLVDANGQMLDFDENLRKIAQAYQIYKSQGNDVMAMDILNAVGATRQRDTAMALINSVNDGSYDKYLEKLADSDVNGYIEEQNAELMKALINQWNAFVTSLQEAGSKIAGSGVIDAMTLMLGGASALLDVIGMIPTPVLTAANAFLVLKGGLAGLEKIGELTGLTEELWLSMNAGNKASRDSASAVQSVVTSLMDREKVSLSMQKSVYGETEAYKQQSQALKDFADGANEAAVAYQNGSINAEQYEKALTDLEYAYVNQTQSIKASATAQKEKQAADKLSASTTENITKAETMANNARNKSLVSLLKEKALTVANTGLKKLGIQASIQERTAEIALNTTKKVSILLGQQFTTVENASTAAKVAGNIASRTAAVGMTLFGSAVAFVTNPMVLLTGALTILPMLFGNSKSKAEELSDTINDLKTDLDETKSRIEELNNLREERGLTAGEEAELQYLKDKNNELERQLKLQEQAKANDEFLNHQGGFLGFGGEDSGSENLDELLDSYNKLTSQVNLYRGTLEQVGDDSQYAEKYNKLLSASNQELSLTASQLITEYYTLDEAINNGTYSGEALDKVTEYHDQLESMLPTLKTLTGSTEDFGNSVKTASEEIEDLQNEISDTSGAISDLNDLFEEYNKEGYISHETISKMLSEHPEYVKYLVKEGDQYKLNTIAEKELAQAKKDIAQTTDELIEKMQNEAKGVGRVSEEYQQALTASNGYINGLKNTFSNVEGFDKFADQLLDINTKFLAGRTTVDDYNNSIDKLLEDMDFSKVNDDLSKMDANTKQVAQSQQAMFSTLTSNVSNYLRDTTMAFQSGEMGISEYVDSLQSSNDQLLQLYTQSNDLILNQQGKWVNAAGEVDQYANSLQNAISGLDGMSEAMSFLSDNYSILSEISSAVAQGQVNDAWWTQMQSSQAYQTMVTDFSSAMSYMYENNRSAWEAIANDVAVANGMTVDDTFSANGAINEGVQLSAGAVNSGINSMLGQLSASISNASSAAGDVISSLGNMIANFDYTIKATPYISGGFGIETDKHGLPTGIKLPSFGFKIEGSGGSSVNDFASALSNFGESIKKIDFGSLVTLNSFKPSNNYRPSGSSGLGSSGYKPSDYDTPATRNPSGTGSKGNKGKSDAEKAAEKASKEAEEAAKAIQRITEQYVKNVESMQDRIAKALKKKYQEQYDERKKLLDKEHEDRIAQIQAEIDKINGDTPQNKQSELDRLKGQLEKWKKDDSTLGKAKQKEYMDQIAELEKEIKLDELEQQMDDENDRYDKLIDQDSEFYDAILKKLDQQMTDEMLYREANDMIRNGKIQEITDLLTKYDAKWDGWATLMGKTAGEVIAEEVAIAIANYVDVMKGTITPDGGKETNKVTGGGSSNYKPSGGGSGSSTSKPVTKGKKVKINDTGAGMYYTSTSKGAVNNWKGYTGTYYVVNDSNGRVALAKNNNVNNAIGWIAKNKVTALASGGLVTRAGRALIGEAGVERVLNNRQTAAFENLIYNQLPKLEKRYTSTGDFGGGTVNNFNKELVKIDVDTVNNYTETDIKNTHDNIDRLVRLSLQKSGIRRSR